MQYAIGPWQWYIAEEIGWWDSPAGSIGSVDLRAKPDRIAQGEYLDHPHSLFLFPDGFRLPSEYAPVTPTRLGHDTWQALLGNSPNGDTVERMLYEHLLDGDPSDTDRCKPIMPSVDRRLELWLGNSRPISEEFRYGIHPHTNVIRDAMRRGIAAAREVLPLGLIRQTLDWELEKYGLKKSEWEEFVPASLRSEIRGPLPHATTWSESFPVTETNVNSAFVDQDHDWTVLGGQPFTVDNALGINFMRSHTLGRTGRIRCETPLSGADHYCESAYDLQSTADTRAAGPGCRFQASSDNCYAALQYGGASGSGNLRIAKIESGSLTLLGSGTSQTQTELKRSQASGSSISAWSGGTSRETVTDTTHTAGNYQGLVFVISAHTAQRMVTPTASDLAGGPTFEATGNVTFQQLQINGSASFTEATSHTATGNVTFEEIAISGAATSTPPVFEASGNVTFEELQISGSASFSLQPPHEASGNVTFEEIELSGTATFIPLAESSGNVTFEELLIAGTASFTPAAAFTASGDVEFEEIVIGGTATFVAADEPIVIPDTAWQYWGPLLLMQDDSVQGSLLLDTTYVKCCIKIKPRITCCVKVVPSITADVRILA